MSCTYQKSFNTKIQFGDRNFQKILDFYLFRCPVEGTNFRSVSFKKHGWFGAKQFARLKKLLLNSASASLSANYYPCKKDELSEKISKVSVISPIDEYCVFLQNEEKTIMQSLFSAIRNSLAHGSFSVKEYTSNGHKEKVYFLVNHHLYLKAEIILRESTLLKWITVVEKGYFE